MAIGDEHHVQLVQWLVDEAHIVLLDGGMLGGGVCEFGERGQQCFHARSLHLAELAGEDGLPRAGRDGGGENDLGMM